MHTTASNVSNTAHKLGTFGGVFTPNILTILGIILFLRLGYVVGSAGLARALVIIALANTISILTTISLSAVATNLKVQGGGVYYLISRTLGPEFGGAIGMVLFLAQSVSIAFYCIGMGEAVSAMLTEVPRLFPQVLAVCAVALLFIFAWLGSDCVIALLLPYLPGITQDLGSRLSSVSKEMDKPLIAYVPHLDKYKVLVEGFELNGIPVSPSIEGAVLMAGVLRRCKSCR